MFLEVRVLVVKVYLRRVVSMLWLSSPQGGAMCPHVSLKPSQEEAARGTTQSTVLCFLVFGDLASEASQSRGRGEARAET